MEVAKKRVGILRGGKGKNYTTSLKRGGDLISNISENLEEKYKIVDILIDKDEIWHINGLPTQPVDLMHRVDIVWNTAGPGVSVLLENFSIPNIGHGAFYSSMEESRDLLKEQMNRIGVHIPRSIVLPFYQKDFDGPREKYATKKAKEVFEKFSSPWIVKSFTPDSNMGIHLAKTFPELVYAIEDGVLHEKSILVEEFILGKIASFHSVPKFRGEPIYIFPLSVSSGNTFGNFSSIEKEKLTALAKYLHQHIGAKHYLKIDFTLTPHGKVYLIGLDSTPDLRLDSHFSQVCESVGAKPHHIIEHILEQNFE